MIEPINFVRKPFYIKAVQVTPENIHEVAAWCDGQVRTQGGPVEGSPENMIRNTFYIKVRVLRALNERQTRAFIGDWVVYAGKGYKVYQPKALTQTFDQLTLEECRELGLIPTPKLGMTPSEELISNIFSGS